MNDRLFVVTTNSPYSVWYRLLGVGKIEVFSISGRIVAQANNPDVPGEIVEWHQFHTLREAKEWLLIEGIKQRMTK